MRGRLDHRLPLDDATRDELGATSTAILAGGNMDKAASRALPFADRRVDKSAFWLVTQRDRPQPPSKKTAPSKNGTCGMLQAWQ
jgi:hypothetical protein